jgi:hypothetical protein
MEQPDRFLELQQDLRAEDRRLLLQLFSDLLKKVTGKYADRFVRVMRMMGIVEECLAGLKDRQWTDPRRVLRDPRGLSRSRRQDGTLPGTR